MGSSESGSGWLCNGGDSLTLHSSCKLGLALLRVVFLKLLLVASKRYKLGLVHRVGSLIISW